MPSHSENAPNHPVIIQGGMGMGVSDWRLARAVSLLGQMGVVSGTAIDSIVARRLQDGDSGGHVRRALAAFPVPEIAERALAKYFLPDGRESEQPYRRIPIFTLSPSREVFELSVLANFVEVFLAKEGHTNPVGINLLHKIQMPNMSSLYGAMLAGVDYVLTGAGIPRDIPAILDRLANHEATEMVIPTETETGTGEARIRFDPREIIPVALPPLKRPYFLAIISSAVLAITLAKKCTGRVDGFIVEGATAGGHNAPPRGTLELNERGEPVYGVRDEPDLEKIRALGLPFWLAGSYAAPEKLVEARARGAAGVQLGTVFAYCEESGMAADIKAAVLERVRRGDIDVFTDPVASPTGYPFKLVRLPGTMADPAEYEARTRICDLGYLRTVYVGLDGKTGYRCSAEPVAEHLRKGGRLPDTVGRVCLCNGLMAAIGLPQVQDDGHVEQAIVTSGDDLRTFPEPLKRGPYTARDVVEFMLGSPVSAVL